MPRRGQRSAEIVYLLPLHTASPRVARRYHLAPFLKFLNARHLPWRESSDTPRPTSIVPNVGVQVSQGVRTVIDNV